MGQLINEALTSIVKGEIDYLQGLDDIHFGRKFNKAFRDIESKSPKRGT